MLTTKAYCRLSSDWLRNGHAISAFLLVYSLMIGRSIPLVATLSVPRSTETNPSTQTISSLSNSVSKAPESTPRLFGDSKSFSSRRSALLLGWKVVVGSVSMAPLAANAAATDTTTTKSNNNLFRGNPLTNGALEQLRIWEQAEADNIRYGGELERGDAGNRGQISAYPTLLVPILRVARDLETVRTAVGGGNSKDNTNSSRDRRSYPDALAILQQPAYQKIAFKRTFNAFADNIYYSDPDRANLYLGGGALPKTEQSLAYLLRNDILNDIEDLRAELVYLIPRPEESDNDLIVYANAASAAMQKYLQIVSPTELRLAEELLSKQDGKSEQ